MRLSCLSTSPLQSGLSLRLPAAISLVAMLSRAGQSHSVYFACSQRGHKISGRSAHIGPESARGRYNQVAWKTRLSAPGALRSGWAVVRRLSSHGGIEGPMKRRITRLPIVQLALVAVSLLAGYALAPVAAQTAAQLEGQVTVRTDGAVYLIAGGQRHWVATVVISDDELNA